MKLSFIVITYQRGALLQVCLDSIYSQRDLPTPFEVILIDNGGDAEADHPGLRLERVPENLGVAGGRNLGMTLARGDYWVFLDDDAIWAEDSCVARMVAHLDRDSQCAGVAVRSLAPDRSPIVAEYPHPNKVYLAGVGEPTEVPYFYGVGHALRASAVSQVGGYPARYFYAMEELDLSLRLIDAGWRILYDPACGVVHFHSTLGRPVIGEVYWRRNMLNKCRVAWRLLPYRYLASTALIWGAAVLLRTRSPGAVGQVLRALWQERKTLRAERHRVKPETVRHLRRIGARLLY
jgi:GT2 family glycosyltransferase